MLDLSLNENLDILYHAYEASAPATHFLESHYFELSVLLNELAHVITIDHNTIHSLVQADHHY